MQIFSRAISPADIQAIYSATNNVDNSSTSTCANIHCVGDNVGIGTTTTGPHRLAVEGSIGARAIKVQTSGGWSDFVFDDDYDLKPLKEVENYITQNNHLPDIPSENEVIKDGINLGEMDAKLLQKIEELTLYLIEQDKKIEELQKKVSTLKK